MLTHSHKLTYLFFDIGGGDAIWIRFFGTDGNWHNVLIDGGYGKMYKAAFGPLIRQILASGECIDLWVISHIDRDHIGAVLGFAKDKGIPCKAAAVREFWFNHTDLEVKPLQKKLAVSDGVKFREYLKEYGLHIRMPITTALSPVNLFGLQLAILSPTPGNLLVANNLWRTEERNMKLCRQAIAADHFKTIEALRSEEFSTDTNPINRSSIALLASYEGIDTLLLADSHPGDIVQSMAELGYNNQNPLAAAFMHLAHHGSKANTSPALLSAVRSNDYAITGNGIHNCHPDKSTLVRVLTRDGRKGEETVFHFACETSELKSLFAVDENPFELYSFRCIYGGAALEGIRFQFLPFNHQP